MLRERLISAVILIPLVVAGILYLPAEWFAFVLGMIIMGAAWEWSALIPLEGNNMRVAYLVITAAALVQVWLAGIQASAVSILLWVALAWWVCAMLWISRPGLGSGHLLSGRIFKALLGVLLLVSAWSALLRLHARPETGPQLVLFLMILIWVADSGAYFAGRKWGRRKLAPAVSPGKTWEGVYGALIACSVFAVASAFLLHTTGARITAFVAVCIVTILFSIVGDLQESLLKRQVGIKDSGSLIPGHGGILDRIDSLIAAGPVFLLGLEWMRL